MAEKYTVFIYPDAVIVGNRIDRKESETILYSNDRNCKYTIPTHNIRYIRESN